MTVREFARLTTKKVHGTLEEATISVADFEWLCNASVSLKSGQSSLVRLENRQSLRLNNYVGILETPSGTQIEILPKHHDESASREACRALLCRMIQVALDLPTRDVGEADIATFDTPLSEWVIQQFLGALDRLLKRGLRFNYVNVEEESRYLRGRLDVAKQLRQPATRQHFFQIRHDVFSPNRAENRLLKSALNIAAVRTANARNWQLAHELLGRLTEIPESTEIARDLKSWQCDRLMAHYELVRPWCELILREQMPLAVQGTWRGISLLFPMEKLFERYVEASLRPIIAQSVHFSSQAASRYLCTHLEKGFFQLRPDMLLLGAEQGWVLDTKWKRLDACDFANGYGLSQADFYQLFAYGHKYLNGKGSLVLIYPKTPTFSIPLAPFYLSETLQLWAMPFDLDTRKLIDSAPAVLPYR